MRRLVRSYPAKLTTVQFEVDAVAPFRLDLTVWALRRRPHNTVDRWDGETYRRTLSLADTVADIAVSQVGRPEAPRLNVSVTTTESVDRSRTQAEATAMLRRTLGLGIDLEDFYRSAEHDRDLHILAGRFRGLKPPRFPSLVEALANAVACQQLTLTVGIKLLNRLAATYGRPATQKQPNAHTFPEAQALCDLDAGALRPLGFSRQKSAALVELSGRVETGEVGLEQLEGLDDDKATTALRALRGIGRWSAEYVLLRGLGRLEIFPGDDVGARNSLRRWTDSSAKLDYNAVRLITSRWAPYSGLVYFHLLLDRIDTAGWLDAEHAS